MKYTKFIENLRQKAKSVLEQSAHQGPAKDRSKGRQRSFVFLVFIYVASLGFLNSATVVQRIFYGLKQI